ncbi:erythrocyte membrane protein 1, PfEMP1, putative [Plasmodium sp.]|nr:erythrocyte membrane protein 1, PfEMP1, putative [Plasmodium sp.]
MVRPPRAPDYTNVKDAKELLDLIGQKVHDQVKNEAQERSNGELKGLLTNATFSGGETASSNDPCNIESEYTKLIGASGKRQPCRKDVKGEDINRFSDKQGAQCDYRKIKGNKNNSEGGACAPFRRLYLCNKNLENINTNRIDNKHDLLAEVCMAAKYEGQTITRDYPLYQQKYPDSGSSICTVLARSFADIGDIVRGKDLYLGGRGRDQLESNLKKIFRNIYDKLLEEMQTNGQKQAIQERYQDDNGGNYYKLREDWWEANRETVWKAITCSADRGNAYFRATCGDIGRGGAQAHHFCRCNGDKPGEDKPNIDPPTYFDYVPQYLRWFEEWAEDFCRKRKKQLENAKNKCRNDDQERYCSGNGYDCTKTVRAHEIYSMENSCPKCFFACNPFVKWLVNQKLEFLKQKEKYENAIKERGYSKNTSHGPINNMYANEFYEELEKQYGSVNLFLGLLSKETACQKHPEVEGKNSVDFTKPKLDEIFSRTEYCKPCPICGGDFDNGVFVSKGDEEGKCPDFFISYVPPNNVHPTNIKILKSGEGHEDINKKLDAFCKKSNDNSSLYEEWKCYHEKGGNDKCVLEYVEEGKKKKKVKEFYDFFRFWVTHMLDDSMEWKEKLRGCLKNGTKIKCKNGCKTPCKCYESWVEEKKKEWNKIKEHFGTQEGFGEGAGLGALGHYVILEQFLENEYFDGISDAYADPQHMEKIKKTLEEKKKERDADPSNEKTIIDFLLEHEKQDAEKCVENNPEKCENTAGGRSLDTPRDTHVDSDHDDEDLDEVHEEDPAVDQDGSEEETAAEVPEAPPTKDVVKPCEIVNTLFTSGDNTALKDACALKYGPGGKEKFPNWKCIPSGDSTATGSESEAKRKRREASGAVTTTGKDGAICVPPRRRRLYVGGLSQWADKVETQVGEAQTPLGDGASTQPSQTTLLRDAFIKSTAIETFFLWDRYKKEWKARRDAELQNGGLHFLGGSSAALGITALTGGAGPQLPSGAGPQGGPASLGGLRPPVLPVPPGFPPGPQLPQALPPQLPNGGFGEGPHGGSVPLPKLVSTVNGDPDDPETKLANGTIPTDFLRLMFYTLADYRDICIGDDTMIKVLEASGDNTMKKINDKIKENLSKQPGPTPRPQKSGIDPKAWWDQNGEHIWKGMICALTYRDSEQKGDGGKPTQDPTVKSALLDNNKPKNGNDYNSVKLEEEEASGAKPVDGSSGVNEQPLTLKDFVGRPTYFRYLEEWGEEFCKERMKKLEEIKYECKVENGGKNGKRCSGYGEDCNDNLRYDPSTVSDLLCPGCGIECRKYKKWIERKEDEFIKQKEIYRQQKTDATSDNGNKYDSNFFKKLKQYASIDLFLQNLGACSKNNDNNKEDKLDFKNPEQTFRPATNCKPCSQFKIDCETYRCDNSKGNKCNEGKITANHIINDKDGNGNIEILVSDNSGNEFKDGLDPCKEAHIFKSFRKEQWICDNVCGYVVCKPEKGNGENVKEKTNGENQIITIRALLTHWVKYFLEDYNRIQKKLNPCMKNSEEKKCTNGCDKKCDCTSKWVDEKRTEWEKIKNRLLEQYKNEQHSSINFNVKSSLDKLDPKTELTKAMKPCKDLNRFQESIYCTETDSSEKKEGEKRKDVVECLLQKLEKLRKEAEKCQKQHSVESQLSGNPEQQMCDESPPVEDEDDEHIEEENPVTQPNICPKVDTPKEEEEDACKPAEAAPKEPAEPAHGEEDEPPEQVPDTESETKVPEVPKKEPEKPEKKNPTKQVEKNPWEHPIVIPSLATSTLMWTVGIGFAAFTYFLLKKKTKSSVGNLFQILQIPRGDYDIPTLKSSNRYIPYASDRYKGKTYIYMEGDSGDEKYTFMSDTSDITSSESEYEELDINNIYPYKSPKYKTLIDVILEPSKRDIQSDDTPTNKFTDNEWNVLKNDFISNILQNEQNDITNNNIIANIPLNTHLNTLYFDNPEEKPFITKIHDRNLYSGEEYSYNINFDVPVSTNINTTTNNNTDDTMCGKNDTYSGIDLINASLNGDYDIYDEILKRKENELFGTNHTKKNTSTNIVAKNTNSDPITNQLQLFHKWLDRHRYMCDQWDKNKKEELLDKLKKEWNKENNNNSAKTYNSDNKSSHNHVLNTDVSIQIDMDNPKTKNEITNMDTNPDKSTTDTILDDLEKYNEPYYYDFYEDDIIYHDVDVEKSSMDDIYVDHNNVTSNNMDVPTKMHIEMNIVNNKKEIFEEEYPISDIWNI